MSQARILVVDDEPGMVRSVERVLGQRFTVATSRTPSAALELAAAFVPDLAILDIRMPEMDGFELMHLLKRAHPGLDVILMTGSVDEHDAKLIRAIREDAFYFIKKPFDREVLLTLVERCLAGRRLAEENRLHLVRLRGELEEARAFQQSLLPPSFARLGRVAIASRYAPCDELGGDLHDFVAAGTDRVSVLVADVSGHGASAAMLTGVVKAAFHAAQAEAFAPLAVVRRIAAGLRPFDPARFVTALCVRVTLDPPALEYVNAGHPPGIVWGRGRRPVLLPPTGLIVSPALAALDWDVERVDLEGAEELLLYTDGIEEAMGDSERLAGWVVENGRSGADLVDAILAACREAAGGRPERDDVTLVSVRW